MLISIDMDMMEAKIMWLLKFTFIVLGVLYELSHYVVTNVYNGISKRLSAYFYRPNKGQA